jgi:IstB-like ATP binding protein
MAQVIMIQKGGHSQKVKKQSQWDSIFSDSMMTVAAVDRLVHHSVIFGN